MTDSGGTVDHVYTVRWADERDGMPWLVECACGKLLMDSNDYQLAVLMRVHLHAHTGRWP